MASPRMLGLALALASLLLYLPTWQNGFILYDDPEYITENPVVRQGITVAGVKWAFTSFHASNWHPLTWLSHMLDCQFFGLDPGAHHMVGSAIHALNTLLLFALTFRSTGTLWPSAMVAALFALHPLHVQSVAWASERKDLLSTCFGFLAILAYRRFVTDQRKPAFHRSSSYWLAVFLFALSLMSKPMLVTLPFLLLLLDYWPLARLRMSPGGRADARVSPGRAVTEKLPFLVLTIGSSVLTYFAQRSEAVVALEGHPLPQRLSNAVVAYVLYLWKMVWPVELSIFYPLQPSIPLGYVILAILLLAVITVAALKLRLTRPWLMVGWFWYLGTLVPVIGLVQVGGQAMADRYTYVPLTGIFLAIVFEVHHRLTEPIQIKTAAAFSGFVLVALAACSFWQILFWRHTGTLFARALAITENNAVAHVNYGMAMEHAGRIPDALEHYSRAVAINPSLAQAHNNLANLLDAQGETQRAITHYREAIRLKPRAALAHANLGGALARANRLEEALKHFERAVQLAPADPRPLYIQGKAFLRAGRPHQAVQSFQSALARAPNDLATIAFLARTLAADPESSVRNGPEALRLAQRAAELTGSGHPLILDTLAAAYAETGDFQRAASIQQEALRIVLQTERSRASAFQARLQSYQRQQPSRDRATDVGL